MNSAYRTDESRDSWVPEGSCPSRSVGGGGKKPDSDSPGELIQDRLTGAGSGGPVGRREWARIALTGSNDRTAATIRMRPPQRGHTNASVRKTRWSRSAHGIHFRRASAGFRSLSAVALGPGAAGTTSARHPDAGARTP